MWQRSPKPTDKMCNKEIIKCPVSLKAFIYKFLTFHYGQPQQ